MALTYIPLLALAVLVGCASPYVPNAKVSSYMSTLSREGAALKLQELLTPSERAAGFCGVKRAYNNMDLAATDVDKSSDFSMGGNVISFIERRKVVVGSSVQPIAGGGTERLIKYVEKPMPNTMILDQLSVMFVDRTDGNKHICKTTPVKPGIMISWWPGKLFARQPINSGAEISYDINIAESDLDMFMAAAYKLNPKFEVSLGRGVE